MATNKKTTTKTKKEVDNKQEKETVNQPSLETELSNALDLLYKNNAVDMNMYQYIKSNIINISNGNLPYINNQPLIEVPTNTQTDRVVLEVSNLTKKYKGRPIPAINNLNFQLKEGEFHVFIGANGAGKTTTIKAIVGAYAKFDGKILINGKDNHTTSAKINLGYIPEKTQFPKNLNTKDYLISMAMMSGISKQNAIKFCNDKLNEFNMTALANKNPNSFSSGQQKKILLAQALVHDPQILIMDEPTANLDPAARHEFYGMMMELMKRGKTIFLSTHLLTEVGRFANHVTILDGGRIMHSTDVTPGTDLEKIYFQYVKQGSVDTGLNNNQFNNPQGFYPTNGFGK